MLGMLNICHEIVYSLNSIESTTIPLLMEFRYLQFDLHVSICGYYHHNDDDNNDDDWKESSTPDLYFHFSIQTIDRFSYKFIHNVNLTISI